MNAQERKSHTQNSGKLHGVFAHHGTAWLGRNCPILLFSAGTGGKEWILFSHMSRGFLRDWFLFCLPQSSDRNEDIVWLSDWRPLKAVAGTIVCESYRGTADSQVAWV